MSDPAPRPPGDKDEYDFYGPVQADKQVIGPYGQIVEQQYILQKSPPRRQYSSRWELHSLSA